MPRGPDIAQDEESFVPAVPGVRVVDFLADAELRGAARTEENRSRIGSALQNPKLAVCGLCVAAACAIGMFTPSKQPLAGQLCAIFYGICTECRRRSDCDWLIGARIAADDRRFGHAVELAAVSQAFPPVLELAEWLERFSPESREFFADPVRNPERFGLHRCSLCGWRRMAVFRFLGGGRPDVPFRALPRVCAGR